MNIGSGPRLWFTWETQRRNRTTSHALDAQLIELDYHHPPPLRYARAIINTLRTWLRRQPRLVFAQNPSMVLALLATSYGRLTRTPVVVDAHNAGILPFEGRKRWSNWLTGNILRQASLTIVTNQALADVVHSRGGRAFVLPDPLPALSPPATPLKLDGEFNVLFICTWASDEPYLNVLEAAGRLPTSTRLYVTGKSRGRERALGKRLPVNVELTGFVSEDEFVRLLYAADLVVDLTTRENCLVCGAYEGIAAGKPLLLSDTAALREYFNRGALYTDNTAPDIARRLQEARTRLEELTQAAHQLQRDLRDDWSQRRAEFLAVLAELERHDTGTQGAAAVPED